MQLVVVMGRRSGLRGRAARGTLRRRLEHFGWSFSEAALDDVLARPELLADADDVAIIGGDGTVHALIEPTAPRPVLVVPAGSGNDLARALGIPDTLAAAEILRRQHRKRIDLGRITCDGRTESFANGVGIGIDGIVAAHHASGFPYALGAAMAIARRPRWTLSIQCGARETTETVLSLGIANGPFCGGGFLMAPEARIDDGLFELVGVRPLPVAEYLTWLPKARDGRHLAHPAVFTARAAAFTIEACGNDPIPLHVDGEPRTALRIAIEVVPGARAFYAAST